MSCTLELSRQLEIQDCFVAENQQVTFDTSLLHSLLAGHLGEKLGQAALVDRSGSLLFPVL